MASLRKLVRLREELQAVIAEISLKPWLHKPTGKVYLRCRRCERIFHQRRGQRVREGLDEARGDRQEYHLQMARHHRRAAAELKHEGFRDGARYHRWRAAYHVRLARRCLDRNAPYGPPRAFDNEGRDFTPISLQDR